MHAHAPVVTSVRLLLAAVLALAVWVPTVRGDSITPGTFAATLPIGGSTSVQKTVTITQQLTVPLDIFFLTDTTGSMGPAIAGIRSGFSSIVSSVAAVSSDAAFGAGEYRDIFDAFTYRQNIDLTNDAAAVQAAIMAWAAGGGGDLPEANLFALQQAALTTSWRPGSQRFVVWVGDAPGHDPRNGATEASAIAALQSVEATVFAANAPTGPGLDQTGQATRIANATGGSFLGTFDPDDLTDAIIAAITGVITDYSTVELSTVGLGPGLNVSFSPASHTGMFDRSVNRNFLFDVEFTGLAAGVYNFEIAALVDGRVVATETDSIRVGMPTTVIPEPSSFALIGTGLLGVALVLRRRRHS